MIVALSPPKSGWRAVGACAWDRFTSCWETAGSLFASGIKQPLLFPLKLLFGDDALLLQFTQLF